MDTMTRAALTAQTYATFYVTGVLDRMKKNERGQGSVEYAGIVFIVAVICLGAIAALKGNSEIGNAIKGKVKDALDSIKA